MNNRLPNKNRVIPGTPGSFRDGEMTSWFYSVRPRGLLESPKGGGTSSSITSARYPSLKRPRYLLPRPKTPSPTPPSLPQYLRYHLGWRKWAEGSGGGPTPNGMRKLLPRAQSTSHSTEILVVTVGSIAGIDAWEVYIGYSRMGWAMPIE